MSNRMQGKLLWIVSILLLVPIFIQLSGGIYNSSEPMVDSGGVLSKLPLPISIIASSLGILFFCTNYRRAYIAFAMIIAIFITMAVSFILAEPGITFAKSKVLLMLQVLLPISGLLLGQLVVDQRKAIAKSFLYVLLTVIPLQLAATFLAGSLTLTHNLFIFSIYQHFQYVPLIFVSAYVFAISSLWNSYKKLFYLFTPVVFVYAIASISFLTIFSFIASIAVFAFIKLRSHFNKLFALLIVVIALIASIFFMQAYFGIAKTKTNIGKMESNNTVLNADGGQYVGKVKTLTSGKTPANVEERFAIWKLYIPRITESENALFFGHAQPLPREVRTSAHNWYIDMIYNFGLISILPIISLIVYTAVLSWKYRGVLTSELTWLIAIVFYLVVIDNNFKVTFREPYPGIFSYFMWGLLLSKLQLIVNEHARRTASEVSRHSN